MKHDYVKICLVFIVLILIFRPQIVEFLTMLFEKKFY